MAVIQYYITLWYIKLDFCYGKKLLVNPQGVDLGMYVYRNRNYRLIEESFVLKKQKPSEGILVFTTQQQKMVDISKTKVFKHVCCELPPSCESYLL